MEPYPAPGRSRLGVGLFVFLIAAMAGASAAESLADLLAKPGADLSDERSRREIVDQLAVARQQRVQEARQRAAGLGLPLRITRPDGVTQEIAGFEGDEPVYLTTHNANAAISTAANLTRTSHAVDGSGIVIGVWDGGAARTTHQEFGGRTYAKDGAVSIDHATHVAGTLAAAGLNLNARGMAPAATVDSYDWNNDASEMTSRGASAPAQAGKIYLSNHSYGYISGWNYVDNGSRVWEWYGNGTNSAGAEQDFGRYNAYARDQDALAASAPYYLIFRSAGNERVDNPAPGQTVALSPGSATVVSYDPALHPAGDGLYRGGFESIGYEALAKNVMTVGSTTDAVTSGTRDITKANPSSFSSWGPTDDGRIKPDIVANGDGVYSSLNGSNAAYGTYSGTSMSTPNATGSAALLVQLYGDLFPGQAMRASTLKGLLIHSADDRGNPGPDYRFGWGLVNAKAAADLIADHQATPLKQRITESNLSSSIGTQTHSFIWDGVTPIRATLCWTDPAGVATTTSDLRTARLVNNLNLKVTGPGGSEHFPYVMPFVGTWTQESMNSAAVAGVNNTDNVEQVLIAAPLAGTYQVTVSYSGTLTNASQRYSLLISGSAAEEPPPPPLTVTAVSPSSSFTGSVTLDLTGTGFTGNTAVRLTRAGHADIAASGEQLVGNSLRCQVNLEGAAAGLWNVTADNPGDEIFTLADAFTVIGALWSENFEASPGGWASQAGTGTNEWTLTSALSHSPAVSYFAPAPETKSTVNLTSPLIPVPSNATNLQLRFWHSYNLQSGQDGGKLEFSIDGGAWFDVTSVSSGVSFAANGYTTTIAATGQPAGRSEFAGQTAWSGNSNGFIETVLNFTETAKFAGHTLRMRWRLATNASTPSAGWSVDTIALIGGGDFVNQAPSIEAGPAVPTTETATDPDGTVFYLLRGAATALTVQAADDGGEPALSYAWSVASGPGSAVGFSASGDNLAKTTEASFGAPGDYQLSVQIADAGGLTTTGSINLRVLQAASDLSLSPASATVPVGASQAFAATLKDQFGNSMPTGSPVWAASGGGTITPEGVFTAATAGGPYVISATAGGFSGNASVAVTPAAATVTLGDFQQVYNGGPREVTVTTTPPGLAVTVTYNGGPSIPVNAGSYDVEANITDPNHQGEASGVLNVSKAPATVTLSNLSQMFDGTPKQVSVTTSPPGLAISVSYAGSATATVTVGIYPVVATVNDANYQGSATGQFTILGMTYDLWRDTEFTEQEIADGLAEASGDPDHDGLENLLEYALGSNPQSFSPSPGMTIDETHVKLSFVRPKGRADLAYHVESGSNLTGWSPVALEIGSETASTESVEARVERSTDPSKLFMRLRIEPQ